MRLYELRKNPQLNIKKSSYNILSDIYESTDDYINDIKNLFVSFTTEEKLGINPQSEYQDTPLGIFAYSAEYLLKVKNFNQVPFGTFPWINIFQARGNIIDNSINNDQVDEYLNILKTQISSWIIEEAEDQYSDIVDPLKRFWLITGFISGELSKKPNPIKWNTLFRNLNIDGIIDHGAGIIHRKQPSQAVFFSIKSIFNLKRHPNKTIISP